MILNEKEGAVRHMGEKTDGYSASDLADLDAMFGQNDEATRNAENIALSQNLDGFASCFPDWDVHPPVKI